MIVNRQLILVGKLNKLVEEEEEEEKVKMQSEEDLENRLVKEDLKRGLRRKKKK